MCGTCGCGNTNDGVTYRRPGKEQNTQNGGQGESRVSSSNHDHMHTHAHTHDHNHSHSHDHDHSHGHSHGDDARSREIRLEQDILAHNQLLAERNRGYFEAKNIKALNLVSSPGAGKTTLLEKTIEQLKKECSFFVIEGDQQTMNDAERIDATGVPVVQVNTGSGCHLDASMVNRAVKELSPEEGSVLMIENVGNLVCPAMFDLGETARVVVISVTEGDDKPIKYPNIFQHSDVCIINKIDLLPYVTFDVEKTKAYARRIQPDILFFETSATTGEGMEEWYEWLKNQKP